MNPKEYLACGNIMSDVVEKDDGSLSDLKIGGPALYALGGIRLFTKNCKLVSQVGADYEVDYGKWLDDNNISRESIRVAVEHCTQHLIHHMPDGSYTHKSKYGAEQLGYLKTSPEHVDAASDETTKGMYIAWKGDIVYWDKMAEIKKRKPFKIMWETEAYDIYDGHFGQERFDRLNHVLNIVDMWSLNKIEASSVFDLPVEDEEGILKRIQELPVDLTFFRVGAKGSYAVTPSEILFCPSIDVTTSFDPLGCGNCSTGAFMYGIASGKDLAESLVIANVAAGYNCMQYGPTPLMNDKVMEEAEKLVKDSLKLVRRI